MTQIQVAELAQEIARFVEFKHALGHPYRRGELTLRSFQRFVEGHCDPAGWVSLESMLKDWLMRIEHRKAVTVGLDFGVIRQLCLYRRRYDPDGFVPGQDWAPVKESTPFLPYIFSSEEIRRLIVAAGAHHGRNLGPATLRTLILILYCTGLRLGEAVRLTLPDIDGGQRTFLVRASKGKTRIVPFGADLAPELTAYLTVRQDIVNATGSAAAALLLRNSGQPLSVRVASEAIRHLLRKERLKPARGREGPRPYEFRHAFAVHRLMAWYEAGVDIHARLPWLSAYMGHVNVLGTEVYLAATPELMRLASDRFAGRWQRTGVAP